MRTFFLMMLVCLIGLQSSEQNISSRIAEIKKMYLEANRQKAKLGTKDCKTAKTIEQDGITEIKYPFEQIVQVCTLSNGYTIYTTNFSGWEWLNKTTFYLKDNKIFFAYSAASAEACENEYRAYYDRDQKLIRLLNSSNDCNPDIPLKPAVLRTKKEEIEISEYILNDFKKAQQMLQNKIL